ncbi:hypothetical protein [Flaviaesturariibacter aridisoli]|uniref:Uncharacterized protein n=1 Tax=Flaviaesturariibacter aridisoli TaxID=2545761 RepID=A0A4R4DUF6_9BACT|nr:hypothetical protein [Flaviaesturariibacter aridisoli]TCZ64585.1 hypothetical protein E0486_18180 [Flaviaesturariibacter aridisoli]
MYQKTKNYVATTKVGRLTTKEGQENQPPFQLEQHRNPLPVDLKTCTRILNKGSEQALSESEVEQIANFLWALAQISCDIYLDEKNK